MNAQLAVTSRLHPPARSSATMRALAYWLLAAGSVSVWFVGLILAIGRWTGHAERSLPIGTLLAIVIVMIAAVQLQRTGWTYLGIVPKRAGLAGWIWWSVCSTALLLFGAAVIDTRAGWSVVGLCWALLICAEIIGWAAPAWLTPLRAGRLAHILPRSRPRLRAIAGGVGAEQAERVVADAEPALSTADLLDPQAAPDVVQQITRSSHADGTESVAGLLRARFVAQQRSQVLHVAFCPPMAEKPSVALAQLNGPTAQLKTSEAQTYGIRIDLRLARAPTQPCDVLVHFEARSALVP